jgi:hypothetical protein
VETATQELTGRELDAAIAERVMGWRNLHMERHGDDFPRFGQPPGSAHDCVNVPAFSTDILDVWQIVDRLRGLHFAVEVTSLPTPASNPDRPFYRVCVANHNEPAANRSHVYEWADTAPLAICRAALKVFG